MRTLVWIAVLGLALPLGAGALSADDEPAPPSANPETQARIAKLIEQLGADDFRSREAASRELASLGQAAQKALEDVLRTSESPEVRWRAEQLLRRLHGSTEKPLGSPGERAGERERPEGASGDPIEDVRRLIEQWTKRMQELRNLDPWRDTLPRGPLSRPRLVEVPGLALEKIGPGRVQLRVKRKTDGGAEIEDVYDGSSLRDILLRHPELVALPGMDELKRRDAEQSWPGFDEFLERRLPRVRVEPFGGGQSGFSFSTSQGVSITQGADGVTVRITEKDENGEEKVREFKGESLEQLKRDHPELKKKLEGFGFQVRWGPPEILWPGRPRERLRPLPPTTPQPVPPEREAARAVFGVRLDTPDEALASHLGLAAGKGALVLSVLPNSQAAGMGITRNDIIVKVDGVAVGARSAADLLRKAAAEKAPLTVDLIRRGENVTLSR